MEVMLHDLNDVSPSSDSGRCSPAESVSHSPDSVQRDSSPGYKSMNDEKSEYLADIVYAYTNIGDDAFEFTKEPQKKPVETTNLTLKILERQKANLPIEDLLMEHINQPDNYFFIKPKLPKEVCLVKFVRKQISKELTNNQKFSQVSDKDNHKHSSNNDLSNSSSLNNEHEALNNEYKNELSAENLFQDMSPSLDDKNGNKFKRKSHKKPLGSNKISWSGFSADGSSSSSDAIEQPHFSQSIVSKRQLQSKNFRSNECIGDDSLSQWFNNIVSSVTSKIDGSETKFKVDQPKTSSSNQIKRQLHHRELSSTKCNEDGKAIKYHQRKVSSIVNQDKEEDIMLDFQNIPEDCRSQISTATQIKRKILHKELSSTECNKDVEVIQTFRRKVSSIVNQDKEEDIMSDFQNIPEDCRSQISTATQIKRRLLRAELSSTECNKDCKAVKKHQGKVSSIVNQDKEEDIMFDFQNIPDDCRSQISTATQIKRQILHKELSSTECNKDVEVIQTFRRKVSSKVNQDIEGDIMSDLQNIPEDCRSQISTATQIKRKILHKELSSTECNKDVEVIQTFRRKVSSKVNQDIEGDIMSDLQNIPEDCCSQISTATRIKRQLHHRELSSTECNKDVEVIQTFRRKVSSKVNQDIEGDIMSDFLNIPEECRSQISTATQIKRQLLHRELCSIKCNKDVEVIQKFRRKVSSKVNQDREEDIMSDLLNIPEDCRSQISTATQIKRQLLHRELSSTECKKDGKAVGA